MKIQDCYGYIYDGDCYCQCHLPVSEDDPGVYLISADSKWDYTPRCAICGKVFRYVSYPNAGRNAWFNRERVASGRRHKMAQGSRYGL